MHSATPARAEALNLEFKNWGISSKTQPPAHVHAPEAWKIEEGSSKVLVAVIDTGVDRTHRLLAGNVIHQLVRSVGEAQSHLNVGWDFTLDRAEAPDAHGHGTHVAGIIGAHQDLRLGASGVAHRVTMIPIKYYSDKNTGAVNLRNTVKAIDFAVQQGARIINYSGGGPEFSTEECLAIQRAQQRGVLFVTAAGNEHQNADDQKTAYYPASYQLDNIITVAATDRTNQLITASNWGRKTVDVAAPGDQIFSTVPLNRFDVMTGTSQATAFVSGIAVLLLARNPKLGPAALKQLILESADTIPQLQGKIASAGRANAYRALTLLASKPPMP